jgi:DNA helicase-4
MEWIVVAVLVLIVGSILSSGGDDQKKSKATRKSPSTTPLLAIQTSDWRKQWAPHIDRSKWIPQSTTAHILKRFPPPRATEVSSVLAMSNYFELKLLEEFKAHNETFTALQKKKLKSFFATVEKNPLSDEQMNGCICMDDAVQIVAAAGAGKTSTIVAKVGYALFEGLVKPDEILVLAFNRSVADELRGRIRERLSSFEGIEKVSVSTFNAFGLGVIGKATGRKPSLADWAGPGRDVQKIVEIINGLREKDPSFRNNWDVFRTVFGRDLHDTSEQSEINDDNTSQPRIPTANGEIVKSYEERTIADWLFFNGVRYEYEKPYQHDTVTKDYGQYRPDFYYPDIDLYHEHFALNKAGKAPEHFAGDYVGGVQWKRSLHDDKGTALFETTSYTLRNGEGIESLAQELQKKGISLQFDPERETRGPSPITIEQLAKTIRTFQQHVKSNGFSNQYLHEQITKGDSNHKERLSRFLTLFEAISNEWEKQLRQSENVDFDDMLLMASHHLENEGFQSPHTMVLADEFQDTSQVKVRILKALFASAVGNAHLCVVGDDWQGINRFAGADISVMTDFKKIFDNSTQLLLSTTFRCPDELCKVSSAFVQANPMQIEKSVKTSSRFAKKSLFAFASENQISSMLRLEQDLQSMYDFARDGKLSGDGLNLISVLILGRYRHDSPDDLSKWMRLFGSELAIEFRTVHSAKGLEADYVMLVNVVERQMGFPSQITDDPVLEIAMPHPDPFPMAEERRLFYVALTRARRQLRIYTQSGSVSRFVVELAKGRFLKIETEEGFMNPCPKCNIGTTKQIDGKFGQFEVCSSEHCDFKRNVPSAVAKGAGKSKSIRVTTPIFEKEECPTCNRGTMVIRPGGSGGRFLACSKYPACKTTAKLHNRAT